MAKNKKKSAGKQPSPGQPSPTQKPAVKKATVQQPVSKKPTVKTPVVQQPASKKPVSQAQSSKQGTLSDPASKQPVTTNPVSKKTTPKIAEREQLEHQLHPQLSSNCTSTNRARKFDPLEYLTEEELVEIDKQFAAALKHVDVLLFWTGVDFNHVQKWARIWHLTTLTIAMGPLMDRANPQSPKNKKSTSKYSKYVKGASGRLAQYACLHCSVIVLTNPPPNVYSSRDDNTYQSLEEPILKGIFGNAPVRRIDYLHPTVDGAKHVTYQAWPCDKTTEWADSYRHMPIKKWTNVNWKYQSLLNLSQIDVRPSRKRFLPITTTSQASTKPSSQAQELPSIDRSSMPNDLPELTDSDRKTASAKVEPAEGSVTEEDKARLMSEGCTATDPEPDIECHESRFLATEPGDDQLAGDCSRSEIQFHSQVEKEINFHEDGALSDAPHPPEVEYLIQKCRAPVSPLTVPVVNIDDITAGSEFTVDVDEYSTDHPFLYLKLNCMPRSAIWWKLMWSGSREKNEQPAAMTHL